MIMRADSEIQASCPGCPNITDKRNKDEALNLNTTETDNSKNNSNSSAPLVSVEPNRTPQPREPTPRGRVREVGCSCFFCCSSGFVRECRFWFFSWISKWSNVLGFEILWLSACGFLGPAWLCSGLSCSNSDRAVDRSRSSGR